MRNLKRTDMAPLTERSNNSNNPFENHFTLRQIAEWWRVDPETVRRRFIEEEGVLILGCSGGLIKRRSYLTLRIPESVLRRVYEKETNRAPASDSPTIVNPVDRTLTVGCALADEICKNRKVQRACDLRVMDLDRFRAGRGIAQITALKELQTLRQFWSFLQGRDMCPRNIALLIKAPTISNQNSVVPYTEEEIQAIIDAASTFGRNEYERKRARAIVLTLCHTALRVGDIALLSRDRVAQVQTGWRIFLRATKNNASIYLPIPKVMWEALSNVPVPRGSDRNCRFYFWNERSKPKSVISVVSETLCAVFRASGVRYAHAHRFRHSLATRLLGAGGTFEEVADVLGNSVPIVRKHYAKWSTQRQARVDELLSRVNGHAWD